MTRDNGDVTVDLRCIRLDSGPFRIVTDLLIGFKVVGVVVSNTKHLIALLKVCSPTVKVLIYTSCNVI